MILERPCLGATGRIVSAESRCGVLSHHIDFPGVDAYFGLPCAELEVEGLRLSRLQRWARWRWRRWADHTRPPVWWSYPLGKQAMITVPRQGWPPVGTVCRITGYEGVPPQRLGPEYLLRYGPEPDDEVWTRLPAEGIELG